MTLVGLDGTPLLPIGAAGRGFQPSLAGLTNTAMDAALEAIIMVGYMRTSDGASHTIDTTGSSAMEWRSGTTTFANAGTSVKVGLATVDLTAGPPGRAVNVTDTITFDVSKTHTGGGGGITTAAWQTNVPDAGTKTIANGDLVAFCVQMVTRGGADSVQASFSATLGATISIPFVTAFTGGSYATGAGSPNAVITFSDGATGYFYGGVVASVGSSTMTIDADLTLKEGGNLLQFPFPVRAYGIYGGYSIPANHDAILYSDPLGTPVAERTISQDANAIAASATTNSSYLLFPSPYDIAANTPVVAAIKASSTAVSLAYKTFNAAAHQNAEPLGQNCYRVTRDTGAFAQQNSGMERAAIGLLIGAFDGGGSGGLASPMHGMAVS